MSTQTKASHNITFSDLGWGNPAKDNPQHLIKKDASE